MCAVSGDSGRIRLSSEPSATASPTSLCFHGFGTKPGTKKRPLPDSRLRPSHKCSVVKSMKWTPPNRAFSHCHHRDCERNKLARRGATAGGLQRHSATPDSSLGEQAEHSRTRNREVTKSQPGSLASTQQDWGRQSRSCYCKRMSARTT